MSNFPREDNLAQAHSKSCSVNALDNNARTLVGAPQDISFPLGEMFGISGIRLIDHGGCQSQARPKRRTFNQVSLRVLWGNG
jgi:hypothetical protein